MAEVMNSLAQRKDIPPQWQEGSLVRLYNGKGKKEKCSNEIGITLASNVGKVFERIMIDHILLLQELIKEGKRKKMQCT